MAVCFCLLASQRRSALGAADASSRERNGCAESGEPDGAECADSEISELSCVEAFICDASVASGCRHPYGAGATGAFGCGDDDDLYARAESSGCDCGEPGGFVIADGARKRDPSFEDDYGARASDQM